MKLLLVVLLAVALTSGKVVQKPDGLIHDLQDFLDLVPGHEMTDIKHEHLENDAELQATIKFVNSDEFKTIILTVEAIPKFSELLSYVQESGLDVYSFLGRIHQQLGMAPFEPVRSRAKRSLNSMFDEIIAILPRQELRALFQEKLPTSPEFKYLVERLRSTEFQNIVMELNELPEYRSLKDRLRQNGVDVDSYIKFNKALYGFSRR